MGRVGIPPERIVRRGKVDEHGEGRRTTGGRTPPVRAGRARRSTSIAGREFGPDGGPDVDEERFIEIWNLVFMQDEVDADCDVVRELPAKNIDTGSSLERVATVLQDKSTPTSRPT